jgi:Phytanoyl-CoA dioxygenase (PhyH)
MRLEVPPIDFQHFHRVELPRRVASGNGELAARDLDGASPIAFQVGADAYTYVPSADSVRIVPGNADAATVVEMSLGAWQEFVHEFRTAFGLLYAGMLSFPRGNFEGLARWEPAVRAMLVGRPIYDPNRLDLRDLDGAALDLHRGFKSDEPQARLRNFLRRTGYLVVKEVFTPVEIEHLREEAERLCAQAVQGDQRSWWAKDEAGSTVLCRITYAGARSAPIAALSDDPRVRQLVDLTGEKVVPVADRLDGPSIVMKVPRATEGLADLPWHVDCGLGLHPILCPCVLIGIQLDAATPESGQLHMLAGSWGSSCRQSDLRLGGELPVVALQTQPGDCTIHFGDTLHAAPGPQGQRGRRTLYLGFSNPPVLEVIGAGEGPNDVLFKSDASVIKSPGELLYNGQ